ncbi:MAG: pirin family protein [Sulfitobacter sp.]
MNPDFLFHPADSREHKDFGFMAADLSFKPHLQADRKKFGPLITIDDGTLEPDAKGFGLHPHKDVEVVTFLVEGTVEHIDPNVSDHNGQMSSKGIQVISAGTGIVHNEVNASSREPMRALQIWFEPHSTGLTPDYSRKQLDPPDYTNKLQLVLSPKRKNGSLAAQQDVRMSYGLFTQAQTISFQPDVPGRSLYVFVINGTGEVDGRSLSKGDAIGIVHAKTMSLGTHPELELLIFDLPPLTPSNSN